MAVSLGHALLCAMVAAEKAGVVKAFKTNGDASLWFVTYFNGGESRTGPWFTSYYLSMKVDHIRVRLMREKDYQAFRDESFSELLDCMSDLGEAIGQNGNGREAWLEG